MHTHDWETQHHALSRFDNTITKTQCLDIQGSLTMHTHGWETQHLDIQGSLTMHTHGWEPQHHALSPMKASCFWTPYKLIHAKTSRKEERPRQEKTPSPTLSWYKTHEPTRLPRAGHTTWRESWGVSPGLVSSCRVVDSSG